MFLSLLKTTESFVYKIVCEDFHTYTTFAIWERERKRAVFRNKKIHFCNREREKKNCFFEVEHKKLNVNIIFWNKKKKHENSLQKLKTE